MGLFGRIFKTKKATEKARKYAIGLSKSNQQNASQWDALFDQPIDDDFYQQLEELMIMSDMGVQTALSISSDLRKYYKKHKPSNPEDKKAGWIEVMQERYVPIQEISEPDFEVIFMMGVNGVGKTTTIGKLAHHYQLKGKKVMMIAADTFRAGAIEQLSIWAERNQVAIYKKEAGSDPSSVIYEGLKRAKEQGYHTVLVDTAGRLQNKKNLMQELDKMVRVAQKVDENAPHEKWLVVDATTGQNGLSQAKVFDEVTQLTGLVLTKADGTAKGGIVFAIYDLFKIPIRFIGLGEKIEDLEVFDIENYLMGWLGESF